jgi:hypothetical protein
MPPSGSLRFWGQPKRFSVLFILPFTASVLVDPPTPLRKEEGSAGNSAMLGLNSLALHIESLTNT